MAICLWMKLVSYAHCNADLRAAQRANQLRPGERGAPGAGAGWALLRFPENLTAANMLWFLAAPTLVYQVQCNGGGVVLCCVVLCVDGVSCAGRACAGRKGPLGGVAGECATSARAPGARAHVSIDNTLLTHLPPPYSHPPSAPPPCNVRRSTSRARRASASAGCCGASPSC